MSKNKKMFYKYKKLPFYIRYGEFSVGSKSSFVCILKSDRHQTYEYNISKFYKPIINIHVEN